jgi:predicted transcriptional regulator
MRTKFTTTLDSDLIKKLKIKAIQDDTDVSKILEKLITEYLKADKKKD